MTAESQLEIEFQEIEKDDDWKEVFQNIRIAELNDSDYDRSNTHARHSLNVKYNRYRDILPYDHSRVKLKNAEQTDYINANYVDSELTKRKYILTQAPLKNTCEHFWQMVWEQNTIGIVMLNKLIEKEISKCEMYYPNVDEDNADLTIEFGKFRLNYLNERLFEDYTIRIIECENLEQKEKRQIFHCHYSNWPDFGEPEYTSSFLNFLRECNDLDIFNQEKYGPPIIHCSAGVGRSGTFILVDSMLQLYKIYEDQIPITISKLLLEFRKNRLGLVQTPGQLRFAYLSIIHGIQLMRYQKENNNNQNLAQTSSDIIVKDVYSDEDEIYDDDDDGDDFYEDDSADEGLKKSTNLKRPDTARNVRNIKKIKPSDSSKKHIKNLRKQQLQHKNHKSMNNENTQLLSETDNGFNSLTNTSSDNENYKADSLKSETRIDKESLRLTNLNDESDEEEYDDDEEEDEETPFAKTSRDIQTVRVNQPRRPLEQALKDPKSNKIQSESTIQNEITETTSNQTSNTTSDLNNSATNSRPTSPTGSSSSRILSEKQSRIAEKVKEMREKQLKHESRKKFSDNIKPIIIGGGILLGGILMHQLARHFFLNR